VACPASSRLGVEPLKIGIFLYFFAKLPGVNYMITIAITIKFLNFQFLILFFSLDCIVVTVFKSLLRSSSLTTCLMQPLLLIRSLHSSHCFSSEEVDWGRR
jgi:hypothetical protein